MCHVLHAANKEDIWCVERDVRLLAVHVAQQDAKLANLACDVARIAKHLPPPQEQDVGTHAMRYRRSDTLWRQRFVKALAATPTSGELATDIAEALHRLLSTI